MSNLVNKNILTGEIQMLVKISQLMFAALLMTSAQAFAADNVCQKNFGAAVSQCAKNLDFLAPNIRAGAQKACVDDAKLAKVVCESGTVDNSQCLNACQATYESNVISCQNAYNPAQCGGNLACEAYYINQRADCISNSVNILNSCSQSCQ